MLLLTGFTLQAVVHFIPIIFFSCLFNCSLYVTNVISIPLGEMHFLCFHCGTARRQTILHPIRALALGR